MKSTMNVSLPPALRRWLADQVRQRGFETADELVRDMIRREREKTIRFQIDQTLIAAIKTPVTEMKDQDWADIEREGRAAQK